MLLSLSIMPDYSVSLENFNTVPLKPQQIITVADVTKPQSHNYLQGRQLHFPIKKIGETEA